MAAAAAPAAAAAVPAVVELAAGHAAVDPAAAGCLAAEAAAPGKAIGAVQQALVLAAAVAHQSSPVDAHVTQLGAEATAAEAAVPAVPAAKATPYVTADASAAAHVTAPHVKAVLAATPQGGVGVQLGVQPGVQREV